MVIREYYLPLLGIKRQFIRSAILAYRYSYCQIVLILLELVI